MQYTPRDLRAADVFALVLVGFGLTLLAFGVIAYVSRPNFATPRAVNNAADAELLSKARTEPPNGLKLGGCGLTLMCLGVALSFKVRQLTRTGGVEPGEPTPPTTT